MSPERVGRDVALEGLQGLAGPKLYLANAFRITGLPTDADRTTVRRRMQRIVPALEAGVDVDLGHSLSVGPDEVRSAFESVLADSRRRLVHELFWMWDTPDASCGCHPKLHADHDAAIRAHSAVLDKELAGERPAALDALWADAGRSWQRVLRKPAFWDHVRARIAALDDKQLDDSVIDGLRDEMPTALVKPLIELAVSATSPNRQTRLADLARTWPAPPHVVEDQLEAIAAPLYDSVDSAMAEVAKLIDGGWTTRAAKAVTDQVLPLLSRLEALVPPERHRRTARARTDAAIALNNCAHKVCEDQGIAEAPQARKWFKQARKLTSDPDTVRAIDGNLAGLEKTVEEFRIVERRVDELVAMGRADLAVTMLNDIKRALRGGVGTKDIDKMLAQVRSGKRRGSRAPLQRSAPPIGSGLTGAGVTPEQVDELMALLADADRPSRRPPAVRPPARTPRPPGPPRPRRTRRPIRLPSWSQVGRALITTVLVAGLVLGAVWFFTRPETASMLSERIADNAPVGRCIATKKGWDDYIHAVPVVDCATEHWGQVLGYVPLERLATPYPGADQVSGTAWLGCLRLLAGRGLSTETFTVTPAFPGPNYWNDGTHFPKFENYAACAVNRIDGKPLPPHPLFDPDTPLNPVVSVEMDLYSRTLRTNPPIGSCVQTKEARDADIHKVQIVSCELPHWAVVIGYPVLYQGDSTFPGDDVVSAAARTACDKIATEKDLKRFKVNVSAPASAWWQPNLTIYAVCTVSRPNDAQFSGDLK